MGRPADTASPFDGDADGLRVEEPVLDEVRRGAAVRGPGGRVLRDVGVFGEEADPELAKVHGVEVDSSGCFRCGVRRFRNIVCFRCWS